MTRPDPAARVLVVGGGVGGAALAVALRGSEHYRPTLFEARTADEAHTGGCYVLWYAGVSALHRLGLTEIGTTVGNPVRRLEMCDALGKVVFARDVGARGDLLGGVPTAIRRVDLLERLHARLGSVDVRYSAALRDVVQDDREVVATFTDGRVERGAALVGADGLHSVVRAHLHGMEPSRHPGYGHWFGIAEDSRVPDNTFSILHGDGARFAHFRLDERTVCWWCVRNAPDGRAGNALGGRTAIGELVHRWSPTCRRLLEATPDASIVRRDTFDRRSVRRWGRGRVTLMGDAAHAMTFDLGQGAGTALSDAVTLSDHLARGEGLLRALRGYEADRSRVTRTLAWSSRQIGGAASWPGSVGSMANRLILATIGSRVTPRLLEHDLSSHRTLSEIP